MNPFAGLGAALIVFIIVLALGYVPDVSELILVASVAVVALCVITLVASARRRHQDRLAAFGRAHSADRRPAQPERDPYQADAGLWRPQSDPSSVQHDLRV